MDIDKDAWTIGGLLSSIAAAWGTTKAVLSRVVDDQRDVKAAICDIKQDLVLSDGSTKFMLRSECGAAHARLHDQIKEIKAQIQAADERGQRRHEDIIRLFATRVGDGR